MAIKIDEKFASVVDAVAKEIVTTEHFGSASLIKVPLMYPSGATAVVQITHAQGRFFVTDMGMGHQEAEMIGASILYNNSAKPLAEHFGPLKQIELVVPFGIILLVLLFRPNGLFGKTVVERV